MLEHGEIICRDVGTYSWSSGRQRDAIDVENLKSIMKLHSRKAGFRIYKCKIAECPYRVKNTWNGSLKDAVVMIFESGSHNHTTSPLTISQVLEHHRVQLPSLAQSNEDSDSDMNHRSLVDESILGNVNNSIFAAGLGAAAREYDHEGQKKRKRPTTETTSAIVPKCEC